MIHIKFALERGDAEKDFVRLAAGHALQWAYSERVTPARRWGVSGCPCRRTRQGADARPLTIPASGSLRAPLCGVPSSRPAASGPSGRAIPGANRPFADVLSAHPCLRLFLSASDASPKPLPVGLLPGSGGEAAESGLRPERYTVRRAGYEQITLCSGLRFTADWL